MVGPAWLVPSHAGTEPPASPADAVAHVPEKEQDVRARCSAGLPVHRPAVVDALLQVRARDDLRDFGVLASTYTQRRQRRCPGRNRVCGVWLSRCKAQEQGIVDIPISRHPPALARRCRRRFILVPRPSWVFPPDRRRHPPTRPIRTIPVIPEKGQCLRRASETLLPVHRLPVVDPLLEVGPRDDGGHLRVPASPEANHLHWGGALLRTCPRQTIDLHDKQPQT